VHIFKIVHAVEWAGAVRFGSYKGSDKDRADGFLHFSKAEQLHGTLAKHYRGMSGVLLVCVDAERLGSELKFEASRDGDLFPHLYLPLPLAAVMWTEPIAVVDGEFHLPKRLAAGGG